MKITENPALVSKTLISLWYSEGEKNTKITVVHPDGKRDTHTIRSIASCTTNEQLGQQWATAILVSTAPVQQQTYYYFIADEKDPKQIQLVESWIRNIRREIGDTYRIIGIETEEV